MDWLGEPSLLWTNHWFTPRACHFCDDLFAEVADVSFMDAWIPEFEREWMGTSLVAVRDRSLIDYFARDLYEPERSVAPIAVDELVRSQSAALADKREGLGYRLARALKRGEATPEKRIDPAVAGSALQRLRWSAQEYFAKRTLDAWAGVGGAEPSMRALAILRRELTVLDVVRRVMARFGS